MLTDDDDAPEIDRIPISVLPWQQEAASAAHVVSIAFETGDAFSEGFDSCTTSRKYVINSPRSLKYKIQYNNTA